MFSNDDRRASITPLDLRQARFKTAMRGFDKSQVNSIIEEASLGYEEAVKENERLRQEIARLEASLQQFRDLETGLKGALVTAQQAADDVRTTAQRAADDVRASAKQAADDIRASAQQDAARIVREAESQAAMMIERGQARCDDLQREVEGLKLKRREVASGLESLVATLSHTLDYVRQEETTRTLRIA